MPPSGSTSAAPALDGLLGALHIPPMRRPFLPLLILLLTAAPLHAQGFCSDLSGPELDRCRDDYYASSDAILGIVLRRALEGRTAGEQSRIRQEQTLWLARRTRLSGVTRVRPRPPAAKLDTLIALTEARINELGALALPKAPWLVALFPGGANGADSLAEVLSMRNDAWRFATWEEGWMQAGHTVYAGQDSVGSFHPTTGHGVTILYAGEDGWSVIITSDDVSTLCGMFRGEIDPQNPHLTESGVVACW